ncbi:MAG: MBL fold metallo-hydrolase [Clostridia bacterium]|nr:MBL fold metallo-hydrolase [Clostridia bacterium]
MKLYHLVTSLLSVNTYFLINDETKEAVVIDGGENYKKVKQAEQSLGVTIKAVLLTHGHFDHAGNAKKLQEDGAKIYISKIDAPKLKNELNLGGNFGRAFDYLDADVTFSDGDKFTICGIDFEVVMTPGHTDGSATFIVENMMFTGDTLFLESVGRTDFPTGSREQLVASIKRLYAREGDYKVYPGHQNFTTLEHERKYNTFVDYD